MGWHSVRLKGHRPHSRGRISVRQAAPFGRQDGEGSWLRAHKGSAFDVGQFMSIRAASVTQHPLRSHIRRCTKLSYSELRMNDIFDD